MIALYKADRWALGIAGALVSAAAMTSCKTYGDIEAIAVLHNPRIGLHVGWDAREATVDETPENGTVRIDVRYLDANGNPVGNGATGVGQGEKVPIPAGATYIEVSGPSQATSCTGCSTPPPSGSPWVVETNPRGLGSPSVRGPTIEKFLSLMTLDADIDGSTILSNLLASFTMQALPNASLEQLHARVAPILFGGPGTPVPLGVSVESFVRMAPEAGGGRLVCADKTTGFQSLRMSWNGAGYADLDSNSLYYSAGNGWRVVEVFVPTSDFNIIGNGSSNSIDLSWSTAEEPALSEVHGAMAYL